MKTKVVTFNGFKYRVANEFGGLAKEGDYTLTATGTVKQFAHQNCLWLEGCPKILQSNDPALKGIVDDYKPTERFVWLDMNTGIFSNSWSLEEYNQNIIDDAIEDSKKESTDKSHKLIRYICENDNDFQFFNLMQIMTNLRNIH